MNINLIEREDGRIYLEVISGDDYQTFLFTTTKDARNALKMTKHLLFTLRDSTLGKNITLIKK